MWLYMMWHTMYSLLWGRRALLGVQFTMRNWFTSLVVDRSHYGLRLLGFALKWGRTLIFTLLLQLFKCDRARYNLGAGFWFKVSDRFCLVLFVTCSVQLYITTELLWERPTYICLGMSYVCLPRMTSQWEGTKEQALWDASFQGNLTKAIFPYMCV